MDKKRYSQLTDSDINYVIAIANSDMSHKEKIDITSDHFGIAERTVRLWWEKLGVKSKTLTKSFDKYSENTLNEDADFVFVFAAQNNTLVNREVLKSIEAYAESWRLKGKTVQLACIPSTYRNPSSVEESQKYMEGMWWDPVIEQYMLYGEHQIGDVVIAADAPVRPTTQNPTSGFEYLADNRSAIIGHPRISNRPMPRMVAFDKLRTLSSTGFITHKNYSRSSAGAKAYKHHSYGFIVIENNHDGTCMIPRNVSIKSEGHFCDLIYEVQNGQVDYIDYFDAIVWGDIHVRVLDEIKVNATLKLYQYPVKNSILHDVFDGATVNPHEAKDIYIKKQKIKSGQFYIQEEIQEAMDFIYRLHNVDEDHNVVVVQSNHDVFLDRHIQDYDWKKDLHNSETYLKLALIMQENDLSVYGGLFGYLLTKEFENKNVQYIPYGSSFRINNREFGLHGDHGVNGSKGNLEGFRKTNRKYTFGHTHTGMLIDNITFVGSSCMLSQYYSRKGISTRNQADELVHSNGKTQLIIYDDQNNCEFTHMI